MLGKNEVDFKFELYAPEYREQTLALLGLLWKKVKPENHDSLFKWKYEDNPYSVSPLIMLCILKGKVVGVLGHMAQRIIINGALHNVCVPVDGIVHPNYRMYRVYSRLLREGVRQIMALNTIYDFKFFFNASSNAASAPGLVKSGWKSLSSRTYYNRFSVVNILMKRRRRWLSEDASMAFSKHRLDITSEIRFRDIERVSATRTDKIFVNHDLEFYNWRYGLNKENYRYAYLYSGSMPVAYMVLNCGSSKQSSIEEYGFVGFNSLRLLITKTARSMRLGILRLFVATISLGEKTTLQKAGFFKESKLLLRLLKKKVRTPVYIKSIYDDASGQDYFVDGVNCLDARNWRLFHADIL